MKSLPLIWVSLALAVLRMKGETGEVFQALAHLWVGGLIGDWIAGRNSTAACLAIALAAVETACFLLSRL